MLMMIIDSTLGCPPDWHKSGEQCYQRNETFLNWAQAQQECAKNGANLAALLSNVGEHLQTLHIFSGAWIGLNSNNYKINPRQFDNLDGSQVSYTPWLFQIARPGGPNSETAHCVAALRSDPGLATELNIGQYPCEETRPYVCMTPLKTVDLNPLDCIKPPEDEGCRRWGFGHRDSCFYMGNDPASVAGLREEFTFEEARR